MNLKDAIDEKDFKKLELVSKKPIFSFLETEIVRSLKRVALNPPPGMVDGGFVTGSSKEESGDSKKKALDSLML